MTTLVYLHGVGDDGSRRDWWESLRAISGDSLDDITVIAPDFGDLLGQPADTIPDLEPPEVTRLEPADPIQRRRYRNAQATLHSRLLDKGSRSVWPYRRQGFARVPGILDAIGERFVMGVLFEEVGKYIDDDRRRRAILTRVLEQLPRDRPIVLLGHSLGALVALDLLMHLPDGTDVSLLVTAASALARRRLPPGVAELPNAFPYERVGGWINVFNPADAVTRGLPIGMRFPQAIDVTVDGGFGDHNLSTCVGDPGVADLLVAALRDRLEVARPARTDDHPRLSRAQAMELATVQIAFHHEQLLALQPQTSPETLAQVAVARRMAGERAALRTGEDHHDWERDHADVLWHGVSETDLPSVLVCVAGANPFAPAKLRLDPALDAEARRRVAVDLGVPPSWVDVASSALLDAAAVFRPIRRRRRGHDDPGDGTDEEEGVHITASVRRSLELVGLAEAVGPSRLRSGIGDIRPVCTALLARALTANRLGTPDPGTEERTVLSRLMVILGDHRARIVAQTGRHDRLLSELRRRTNTVGRSLSWLAEQGLGLAPAR